MSRPVCFEERFDVRNVSTDKTYLQGPSKDFRLSPPLLGTGGLESSGVPFRTYSVLSIPLYSSWSLPRSLRLRDPFREGAYFPRRSCGRQVTVSDDDGSCCQGSEKVESFLRRTLLSCNSSTQTLRTGPGFYHRCGGGNRATFRHTLKEIKPQ